MCIFAKYRHMFGVEGEGIHATRFYGFAVVDVLLTVLAAFLYTRYAMSNNGTYVAVNREFVGRWSLNLAYLLLIGEFVHILFGVRTGVSRPFIDEYFHCPASEEDKIKI